MELFNINMLKDPSILVIHNPYSGKKQDGTKVYNETVSALSAVGFKDIDFKATAKEEDAIEEILSTDKSFILTIGGDSTYSNGLEANKRRGKDILYIAHIPTGTTNDIGRTFGYTRDIMDTIERIFNNGIIREIDIFLFNGKVVAYVAGFGLLVTAAYEATPEMKAKYGRKAYAMTIAEQVRGATKEIKREHILVENNGRISEYNCSLGLFSNSKSIAGFRLNHNGIDLNDGKFEVLLSEADTLPKLLLGIPSFKYGISLPNTKILRAEELKITFDSPNHKAWCIDGDEYKEKTDTYRISTGGKVKIITPSLKC